MLGFLGSSHCLVMCGGIGVALGLGSASKRRTRVLILFQLGRVTTYALLGAGLGAIIGAAANAYSDLLTLLRIASGLLLIAMGCYLADWWRGLVLLESLGQNIWRHVEPLARKRLPISSSADAFSVGMFWGFLPCGLIYTALAWTATSGNSLEAGALMAAFGLGTAPAMLATGLAAERVGTLLRQQGLRRLSAVLLILAGLWTLGIALQHAGSATGDHSGHGSPASHQH